MTKLLYIPSGEYVKFISSFVYDKKYLAENHSLDEEWVINYEDSYSSEHSKMTIEDCIIESLLTGNEPINDEIPINSGMIITREEFEIIYD